MLRWFVAASDSYTASSSSSGCPANRDSPSRMKSHFSSGVVPGTRPVVVIAPAFTRGLRGSPSLSSTAITELNGSPVLLTPTRRATSECPNSWQTSANTNTLEIDWIENGCAASPTLVDSPTTPHTLKPKSAGSALPSDGM